MNKEEKFFSKEQKIFFVKSPRELEIILLQNKSWHTDIPECCWRFFSYLSENRTILGMHGVKNIRFCTSVCVFWNLVSFLKNTAIKQHMSILQKGRHICYEKQKLLRKVCMFFQNVYYAGNICISRNFSIAPSRFWGVLLSIL